MAVILFSLTLFYHLSVNTEPIWLAFAFSILIGMAAWGATSFTLWCIEEYVPEEEEELVRPVRPVRPTKSSSIHNDTKDGAELVRYVNKVLVDNRLIIDNSSLIMNDEDSKKVRTFFIKRWRGPRQNTYFSNKDLPMSVISKLIEKNYAGDKGKNNYRLTMTGEEYFPCKPPT